MNHQFLGRKIQHASMAAIMLAGLAACGQQSGTASDAAPTPAPVDAAPGTAPAAPPQVQATLPSTDSEPVQAAVKGLMDAAYGADRYDQAKQCWTRTFQTPNDELEYCMKPDTPKVVAGEHGAVVYLLAYSDPEAGLYSQVDPGLKGYMAAALKADGHWQLLASTPAIDAGQAGDCACREARLEKLGPATYGWLSVEGGVWQGVAVKTYSLVAPVEEVFKTVASIPQASEVKGETYTLEVDTAGVPTAGLYPLTVTQAGGSTQQRKVNIAFDAAKGIYPWTR